MNVSDWLGAVPLSDNPRSMATREEQTFRTWEEWVSHALKIPFLEECLLAMLEYEKEPYRRSLLVLALGFVGTDLSVTSLINTLQYDVALVQMEAASSLGRLDKPLAVNSLCKALKNHEPNVRANAATALGRLGSTKAKTCLLAALKDEDPFVRAAAKEALCRHKYSAPKSFGTINTSQNLPKGTRLTCHDNLLEESSFE